MVSAQGLVEDKAYHGTVLKMALYWEKVSMLDLA